jgi:hypothetical protein
VLVGGVLLATPGDAAQPEPLPIAGADAIMAHLGTVGLSLSDVRNAEEDQWRADQRFRFTVTKGDSTAEAILLTYLEPSNAGGDYIVAMTQESYKDWQRIQIANTLLLVSPDAATELVAELNSHLTQYLVAPYRDYLPTSTPKP